MIVLGLESSEKMYTRLFGVSEYDTRIGEAKFKMANQICWTDRFLGSLNTILMVINSALKNSNENFPKYDNEIKKLKFMRADPSWWTDCYQKYLKCPVQLEKLWHNSSEDLPNFWTRFQYLHVVIEIRETCFCKMNIKNTK